MITKERFIMTKTTALQVTNFNFYGDELIALKDNATGEIYTTINSVLRGIGFTDRDQIRKRRDRMINDIVLSKGIKRFCIPTMVGVKDDTPINTQEVHCISQHKLPIALAKINITPSMKKNQPELASRLELYQDKCADVLASVFIDRKTTDQVILQPILDTLNTFNQTINHTFLSLNDRLTELEENQVQIQRTLPKKSFSKWTIRMFPKYQALMNYFDIDRKELYHNLFIELQNTYPDIDLRQEQEDYCFENGLNSCFTLEVIEHNHTLRMLFEGIVDSLLEKYDLTDHIELPIKQKSIFN